jgi:hypothetical protein
MDSPSQPQHPVGPSGLEGAGGLTRAESGEAADRAWACGALRRPPMRQIAAGAEEVRKTAARC